MKYLFNPAEGRSAEAEALKRNAPPAGDRRDGSVYLYTGNIILSVNLALVTSRPLLIRGPSGSGKSSLAKNVALKLGWRYYEHVITSRTQARDLLWEFDALRRLNDAQAQLLIKSDPPRPEDSAPYIEPRALWWAFDRNSARRRGMPEGSPVVLAADPDAEHDSEFSVVLLDEIDKADPDVPNNLLVPLGSNEFTVTELGGIKVKATTPPLIFITTNDERELPAAFVRRCLVLTLERPSPERLVEIARAHFESTREDLYRPLADQVQEPASTAEYLDALRACIHLDVKPDPDDRVWREIMSATLRKERSAAIA